MGISATKQLYSLNKEKRIEEGKTKLIAQGWTNDLNVQRTIARTGGADDTPNAGAMATIAPGMYKLTGKLQQKRWFTFVIRPHLPVFASGRLLVPGVELKLDLHLNPMSQLLFQTEKHTFCTNDFLRLCAKDFSSINA